MKPVLIAIASALVGGATALAVVLADRSGDVVAAPDSPSVEVLGFESGRSERTPPRPAVEEPQPADRLPATPPAPESPRGQTPAEESAVRAAVSRAFDRERAARPGLAVEIRWRAEERMARLHAVAAFTEDQLDRAATLLVAVAEEDLDLRDRIVSRSAAAAERYRGWFADGLRHESCPGGDIRPVLERIDPRIARLSDARRALFLRLRDDLEPLLSPEQGGRLARAARIPE